MTADFHERAPAALRGSGFDSLLLVKHPNIRYVTGFDCDSGHAAVTASETALFVNPLFVEHAREVVFPRTVVREVKDDPMGALAALGERFWGKRIGFEPDGVTWAFHAKVESSLSPAVLVPGEGIIETARERKEPFELESIRAAQVIAEKAFRETLPLFREGIEEREAANEIDYRMRRLGGERPAFDTIVAFGPNAAKPHAVPSRSTLRRGDFVLVDMGTVMNGYSSDMTRTFVFGKADARRREVYSAVLDAQEAALERIAGGLACAEAHRIAFDVLDRAGFGKEFIHSLGHGVGLEVHEIPRLSPKSDATLKNGCVVTVEPGVYIPGWGGVRIEDMVHVTATGCENLTGVEKGLMEV